MRKFPVLIIIFLFTTQLPAKAPSCAQVLVSPAGPTKMVAASVNTEATQEFTEQDLNYASRSRPPGLKPTVKARRRLKDRGGLEMLLLELVGENWNSNYTPAPMNEQGNPQVFVILMGGPVAAYFKFYSVSDAQMTVPTAATFNLLIEKLNVRLVATSPEPIAIRFHETDVKAEEGTSFLANVAGGDFFSLPMAKNGHYAVHDIAFHLLAILLPKSVTDNMRARARVISRLKSRIAQDASLNDFERALLNQYADSVGDQVVKDIDAITGTFGGLFAKEKIVQRRGTNDYVVDQYEMLEKLVEPLIRTQNTVGDLPVNLGRIIDVTFTSDKQIQDDKKHFPKDMPLVERKRLIENAEKSLENFQTTYARAEQQAIWDCADIKPAKISKEEFTRRLIAFARARIAAIQQAVREK